MNERVNQIMTFLLLLTMLIIALHVGYNLLNMDTKIVRNISVKNNSTGVYRHVKNGSVVFELYITAEERE